MDAQSVEEVVVASAALFAGLVLLVKPGRLGELGELIGRVGAARVPLGLLFAAAGLLMIAIYVAEH